MRVCATALGMFVFCFLFFFPHRSNSALHRRSSIKILLDQWATFCRRASQCLFFVSGSSRIRTHVLVITMRTCYRYATSTPHIGKVCHWLWSVVMVRIHGQESRGAFPTLFCGPPQTATAGSCKSVSAQYSR